MDQIESPCERNRNRHVHRDAPHVTSNRVVEDRRTPRHSRTANSRSSSSIAVPTTHLQPDREIASKGTSMDRRQHAAVTVVRNDSADEQSPPLGMHCGETAGTRRFVERAPTDRTGEGMPRASIHEGNRTRVIDNRRSNILVIADVSTGMEYQCSRCDRSIVLRQHPTSCPHCGHPPRRGAD